VTTFTYDGRKPGATDLPPHGVPGPTASLVLVLSRSLEFRLCCSEEQQQSVAHGLPSIHVSIATANNLRVYLTQRGDPGAAKASIGGVELWTELRPNELVCVARLSDFTEGDLVVVQVDVAIYNGSAR
jgi:hypothetical protein